MVSKRWWWVLVVVGLVLPGYPVRAAPAATTLTLGVDQEVVGLDPNLVTAFSSFRRVDFLYNKLVRYNDRLEIEPDLAESWEYQDPRTITFHLRRGVKFHDGTEMTSEDVKFTLERVLDPASRSPGRSFIDVIKQVETPDRYTVRLKLSLPLASLLSGLSSANLSIVSKAAVQRYGDLQRNVVGTGPYTLAEWTPDNFMRLARNPDYFRRGLPKSDAIILRVILDKPSLLADAGYPNGFSTRIVTSPTYEGGIAVAQVIQEQLRAVGVTATLDTVEWGTYINRWVARDFDTMIELRGGDPDPDRFLYRTFHSTGAVNNFLFKDTAIDRLLERGRVNIDATRRKTIYDELQRVLIEAAPALFLYVPMETQVLQPYVQGFRIIGNGALYYLEEASLER